MFQTFIATTRTSTCFTPLPKHWRHNKTVIYTIKRHYMASVSKPHSITRLSLLGRELDLYGKVAILKHGTFIASSTKRKISWYEKEIWIRKELPKIQCRAVCVFLKHLWFWKLISHLFSWTLILIQSNIKGYEFWFAPKKCSKNFSSLKKHHIVIEKYSCLYSCFGQPDFYLPLLIFWSPVKQTNH